FSKRLMPRRKYRSFTVVRAGSVNSERSTAKPRRALVSKWAGLRSQASATTWLPAMARMDRLEPECLFLMGHHLAERRNDVRGASPPTVWIETFWSVPSDIRITARRRCGESRRTDSRAVRTDVEGPRGKSASGHPLRRVVYRWTLPEPIPPPRRFLDRDLFVWGCLQCGG